MIIYSESVHVETSVEKEWLEWMRTFFIPEIINKGQFTKAIFTKVTSHKDDFGNTFSVQYYAENQEILSEYKKHYFHLSHDLMGGKFGNKTLIFSTELEIIGIFT